MDIPESRPEQSKEGFAGGLSILTFHWIAPLMRKAYKTSLTADDIWMVNSNREISRLLQKFDSFFLVAINSRRKQVILWVLYRTFRKELVLGGVLQLFSTTSQIVAPYILRYIIECSTEANIAGKKRLRSINIGRGVGLVCLLVAVQSIQCLVTSHMLYISTMIGAESRAILTSKIFDKALSSSSATVSGPEQQIKTQTIQNDNSVSQSKTNQNQVSDRSTSEAINLTTMDTKRIEQAIGVIHLLWALPMAIFVGLGLLFINIGSSTFSGFACIVVLVPLLTYAMKSLVTFRAFINKQSNERVSRLQEVLRCVWFIKISALEENFIDKINDLREKERRYLGFSAILKNACLAASASLPVFASVASFATFAKTGHNLKAGPIFSSFALWNALRFPLAIIPMVLGMAAEALSAIKRVETFLLSEDYSDFVEFSESESFAFKVENADFSWTSNDTHKLFSPHTMTPGPLSPQSISTSSEGSMVELLQIRTGLPKPSEQDPSTHKFCLRNINFFGHKGELIGIFGRSGSGKSSLISALAGEMVKFNGRVIFDGPKAVCYQKPWLQSASIRENVLFGRSMDVDWYYQVIDACGLRFDIELLPEGDNTHVGEGGLKVSGGQKQRICLARAIYTKAENILLDDPLSALDVATSQHVLENAICGLLRKSCCVLATHDIRALRKCHKVVWIEDSLIKAIGTPNDLLNGLEDYIEPPEIETTSREFGANSTTHLQLKPAEVEDRQSESGEKLSAFGHTTSTPKNARAQTYLQYIWALGSPLTMLSAAVLLIVAQGSTVITGLWLSYWISDRFHLTMNQYIGIYLGLGFAQALLAFIVGAMITYLATRTSIKVTAKSLRAVISSPMDFFVKTSVGEITSRLIDDTDHLDNGLPEAFRLFMTTITGLGSIFVLLIAVVHYFAIAAVIICLSLLALSMYYKASTRSLKHHEAIRRSQMLVVLSQALAGRSTIRAYGQVQQFMARFRESVDQVSAPAFLALATQRWLCLRLDLISTLLLLAVGLIVATGAFDLSPHISGLLLAYILPITQVLQILVRQLAEVEADMLSFERNLDYTKLPPEDNKPWHSQNPAWPQSGFLVFQDVSMRYHDDEPAVLQNISFDVHHGEKIGIVGRTGAGKSSLIKLICGIVRPSAGTITIDGVDIATIKLKTLRSNLTVIPQDPTLFTGTVRSNLDPFGQHQDTDLLLALERVGLHGYQKLNLLSTMATKEISHDYNTQFLTLDTMIEPNAVNLSVGQQQLLALARALLRDSKIVLCDEATSSIDDATDNMIHQTLSTSLKDKTVLFIAHRLKSVLHYDRICVTDKGRVVEMDTPQNLWNKNGLFRKMCETARIELQDIQSSH
ncbi:ABC multidrug transporter [Lojkania enalia]|uniref:ABC multidrug transporter n=1 Tax=Lojkania enalia TaxID=147567 RepID=A0A9P4K4R1_9PLEO|nr:ABC multidrug transporter [Didymosphaeria enalia]